MGINKLLALLLIFVGVGCFINSFLTASRGVTFAGFFTLLGVFFTAWGLIKIFVPKEFIIEKFGLAVSLFRAAVIFVLVFFALIQVFIVSSGIRTNTSKADYLLILGAGVNGDTPSLVLYERLNAGLNYLKTNKVNKIIVSGGQGPGENISEAEAMKRYLISKGIDESSIIKEEKSTNTLENIKFSKIVMIEINKSNNFKTAIVTSGFHMFRAQFLAKRAGFETYSVPAPIPTWLIPTYYVRESFAVLKSLIFDRS